MPSLFAATSLFQSLVHTVTCSYIDHLFFINFLHHCDMIKAEMREWDVPYPNTQHLPLG